MHLHIVFQLNLGKLLFRATLKVRLASCLSTALKMDNLDCTKINAHFKKFTACIWEGLIHECKHTLLAYFVSPTSPPYVGKQLTALFHTQPLLKYLVYGIAAPTVNCVF